MYEEILSAVYSNTNYYIISNMQAYVISFIHHLLLGIYDKDVLITNIMSRMRTH